MVSISLERLQKLEELENSLPAMIEQAIQENKKKNLSRLHEKDKQNPESVNLRVKRYAARHKETLNARRRAKREQKKKAQQENNNHVVYPDASAPAGGSPIPAANFATLVPHLDVITVRFDN
jgi:exonuclease VII large subunit